MVKTITLDEHRLWVVFHQTLDLITKYEDKILEVANISREQFLVLWLMEFMKVVSHDPIIMTELSSSLYRNLNSISAIIDRMQKIGLIEKVRDLPDRRTIRLNTTIKGDNTFNKAIKVDKKVIKSLFSIFSDDEVRILLSLLKRLKAKINIDAGFEEVKTDPTLNNHKKIVEFLKKESV